jgi:hypothetical protein
MHRACHSQPLLNFAFKPFQIVCLEHETTQLYAEVVQTTETTYICWVRPLLLIQALTEQSQSLPQKDFALYDLRQGSDLLLPASLFRAALDTEMIPLLAKLNGQNDYKDFYATHLKLNQFIQQVCLAYPEVFKNKSS